MCKDWKFELYGDVNMKQEFEISQERKRQYLILGVVYLLLFLFAFYFGIKVWQDPSSSSLRKYIIYPLLIFCTFGGTALCLYNGLFMKILINDEYIKFVEFGYTITAKWVRLIKIENYNVGRYSFEGIRVMDWNVKRNFFGLLSPRSNHIPIHNFGKNWRRTKLGHQIKQYAPHLFEKEKSA
jgi:hypothetical protein